MGGQGATQCSSKEAVLYFGSQDQTFGLTVPPVNMELKSESRVDMMFSFPGQGNPGACVVPPRGLVPGMVSGHA
jgi:hypothetical protein